jgi:hypothetical protein
LRSNWLFNCFDPPHKGSRAIASNPFKGEHA